MFVYTPPMPVQIERLQTVQTYQRRFECFEREDQANQWALDMEESGWQVIEFTKDRLASALRVVKPWYVTVQAPAYIANRAA